MAICCGLTRLFGLALAGALLLSLPACQTTGTGGSGEASDVARRANGTAAVAGIDRQPWGVTPDGPAELFTLTNRHGLVAKLTNYGATLVEMHTPDRNGAMADITLGFDSIDGYLSDSNQHFGSTIGRVANRIARGRFMLAGQLYQLAVNNGPNSLHGGEVRPFDEVIWSAEPRETPAGPSVRFSYFSPAGEEGYPGSLLTRVTYTLTHDNELRIDYRAVTDAITPVNLTNHAYWNLRGAGEGTILGHQLMIDAGRYTPVDENLIPTGQIASVEGTPLDFRQPQVIGDRIDELIDTPTLGYDHNYVLDRGGSGATGGASGGPVLVAAVRDPVSGRMLVVLTTEPGLQFYSGNFLKGQTGKDGQVYEQRGAFCLEAQHFPDSVNQPNFPSTLLRPGEEYMQTTIYRFRVE